MPKPRRASEPPAGINRPAAQPPSPVKCDCEKEYVYSKKLGANFTVYVQNEVGLNKSNCCILTLHDIGTTHSEFHNFINHPATEAMRDRIVWLHVELPGQEDHAPQLNITKYPTLEELAKELIIVLEAAKISEPVLMGEGVGASIAVRFAMMYPSVCAGLILIRPTATSAGIKETMFDKLYTWRLNSKGMMSEVANYLAWNTFGDVHDKSINANSKRRNTTPVEDAAIKFREDLEHKRNPKNLALLFGAISSRTDITDDMRFIKCDVLAVCGKKTAVLHTTEKFFDKFKESRQQSDETIKNLENSGLIVFEDVGNVIIEAPDRLASAMQYFLQGIGLISGVPLAKGLEGLGQRNRDRGYSMTIADTPADLHAK